jgi:uncharacterized protein YcnI
MRSELLAVMLLPALAVPAAAHLMLTQPSAAPGTNYVAHFRMEHGCSGSPTTGLQIVMPPGVSAVMPETPAGWSLATVRAGGRITVVTWKGGILAADKSGDFTIAMHLPDNPGTLVFPATQTCEKGVVQWSDLPAAPGAPKPQYPAPVLTVSPNPTPAPNAMPSGMKM